MTGHDLRKTPVGPCAQCNQTVYKQNMTICRKCKIILHNHCLGEHIIMHQSIEKGKREE